jgi:hypothetical protein
MIPPELRSRIRRLFFAEHWKIGTIAAELCVHRDTVELAVEPQRFSTPRSAHPRRYLIPTRTSCGRRSKTIRGFERRACSR